MLTNTPASTASGDRICVGTREEWTYPGIVQAAGCTGIQRADFEEAVRYCLEDAIGDGLPMVPPTGAAISEVLSYTCRPASEIIGTLDSRGGALTVLQAAACTVMAGAQPQAFPVVLATWDALFDSTFNLNAVLSSSGGAALTCVVSGSRAAAIDMNSGAGLFGPGNRANATVGRAIRLGAITALGARYPMDASSFGNPSKFGSHFAEGAPPPGWPTLRESLAFGPDESTVTVMGTDAPRQVYQSSSRGGERLLKCLSACMSDCSHIAAGTALGRGSGLNFMVVLGPEHAHILSERGLSRDEIAQELVTRSRLTAQDLERAGVVLMEDRHVADDDGLYPSTRAERVLVVTAGAAGAGWSAVIPGWAYALESIPTSRKIGEST